MNKKFSVLIKKKISKFNKVIKIPPDKGLSLRSLLLASQCIGKSKIKNLLESDDVLICMKALKTLGVKIIKSNNVYIVHGNGLNSFKVKKRITKIFVGNSATTARLLMGLLSTHSGKFYLYGDSSINKRDMSRVIKPLEKVGCFFYPKGKSTLPLTIEGTSMPLAQQHIENRGSAQVKSLILLSALSTPGITTIKENKISRNHSEIFLKKIKADIKVKKLKRRNLISLKGQKDLHGFDYTVSADPSSGAFLIALTLLIPYSKLVIHNVLCNPTRAGFIKILKKMNANIKVKNLKYVSGEPVGSIIVKSSTLRAINCSKRLVPSLIDEFPILFVISALTEGVSKFEDISELTTKESNRILEMKKILTQIGINCHSTKSSMFIQGKKNIDIKNNLITVNTKLDHRICMSSVILSLVTGIKIKVKNFETVNTSFPGFVSLIRSMGGEVEIKK
ncbi:MAG: 3-phosphoshikimate 1-carboxyvinyltransferase [Pelagibacteraceae bacterium]|jgi:3-phosphoshikimate 1-carboxyvinyltransferase|nr:3-phosphoshikimate 1-carboxyvinyltransferase [Pelagibacteraceae bacterium]MDP6710135.1 3-phosphoshikimate 1-carboxyvinyltransferase [Pelagibacteraceae bacterium]|tara:strand:- start:1860 stop:3206 length:1347 start_codon:yes stop_codon:yes gene_type:complete